MNELLKKNEFELDENQKIYVNAMKDLWELETNPDE